ncbi:MAG: hypothetical protein AAF299_03645 [Pseudomonadota bacterium]
MQSSPSKPVKLWRTAAMTALCLLFAGCGQSNIERTDKISAASGDAVRAATVMQTVDPWPEYVLDTDVDMDGELAVKRVNDYKKGETKPLQGERSSGGSSTSTGE